jgi:adenosylhomocysteinase
MLGHILPTTESLIYLLDNAGAEIQCIIGKPYSIDRAVLGRLKKNGYKLILKSYKELETTNILDTVLLDSVRESQKDKRKILIFEVGGYFAKPLTRLKKSTRSFFAGIVEDTTLGHNRYLDEINNIYIPVASVARSRLKEMEAHFVGRDAVMSLVFVMREIGESITGRHAVVIGYGMIGKHVARCLQAYDLNVSVYYMRDHRNLKAFMMGFNVSKKLELLRTADIVFAATGWSAYRNVKRKPALCKDEILDNLKDNSILVSVGSKNNEFEIEELKELATKEKKLGKNLVEYTLPTKNIVIVAKDGTAINFLLPSIPTEILDIVFSEIVLAGLLLLKNPNDFSIGTVHQIKEIYLSQIAKDWLRFVNH